ncbi:hypothetical protein ES707_12615 [subsurface metagenome]
MMIAHVGIRCIQASTPTMLDDNIILAGTWIERGSLFTGGDKTMGMRCVMVYIVDKMCYPSFSTRLICDFVDDVTELSGLREYLIDVGVLYSHQARIVKSCIRGRLARLQAQPINVVCLSVEALGESS